MRDPQPMAANATVLRNQGGNSTSPFLCIPLMQDSLSFHRVDSKMDHTKPTQNSGRKETVVDNSQPYLQMPLCNGINIEEYSIIQLNDGLKRGIFSCYHLVTCYLERIEKINVLLKHGNLPLS
jgi:hypothetical protein